MQDGAVGRIRLIAFGITIAVGVVSGALGVGQSWLGAVSGGTIGLLIVLRMGRLRRCPACSASLLLPAQSKNAA